MTETLPGVYKTQRKDNSIYYRASITYRGKHLSLGSFDDPVKASEAYRCADRVLRTGTEGILEYDEKSIPVTFAKWVMLINFRDNGIYCNGPIYLRNRYFEYYLDTTTVLRFGAEELFYYTHHGIQRRGGHLFVADYGMQVNILNRYGIRNHAVKNKDYYFKNGDDTDFRSGNVVIVNKYFGVRKELYRGKNYFTVRIHVVGDIVAGRYDNETDAAIAYNKAAKILNSKGVMIDFPENYIDDISKAEYKLRYDRIRLSKRIREYENP